MNIEHMRNKYNIQREKGTMEEGKSKREEKPNESERHRSNSSETRGWRGKCAFPMRVNYRKGEDKRREKMGTTPQRFLLPLCVGGVSVSIQRKNKVQGIIIIIQQCRHSWPTVTSFHSLFIPFPADFQGVPLRAFVREATLLLLLTRRLGGLLLSIRDERVGRKKKKKKEWGRHAQKKLPSSSSSSSPDFKWQLNTQRRLELVTADKEVKQELCTASSQEIFRRREKTAEKVSFFLYPHSTEKKKKLMKKSRAPTHISVL